MRTFFFGTGITVLAGAALCSAGFLPTSDLFRAAPNPCSAGAMICNGELSCRTPLGACPEFGRCTPMPFVDQDLGGTYWFCICFGPGPTPDPRNQPDWDCGVAQFEGAGGATTPVCLNSANCSPTQSCALSQDGNACFSCSCK